MFKRWCFPFFLFFCICFPGESLNYIYLQIADFKYLFAVVFVCGLATICSSGKPTVEKIETNCMLT